MKATGIIRKVDSLGRLVLPKEIRKTMRIVEGTPMEIFTSSEGIMIKRYYPALELSDILKNLDEFLDDAYIDLGTKKMDDIRQHIRKIQVIIEDKNLNETDNY